jgi:RHS repeat-associated protein
MTDARQKIVWDRINEPFGETLDIKGSATLNLRFPGQYHDAESGLDYNFFRSYNPETGRYTQSDPIGLLAGINTYRTFNSREMLK